MDETEPPDIDGGLPHWFRVVVPSGITAAPIVFCCARVVSFEMVVVDNALLGRFETVGGFEKVDIAGLGDLFAEILLAFVVGDLFDDILLAFVVGDFFDDIL